MQNKLKIYLYQALTLWLFLPTTIVFSENLAGFESQFNGHIKGQFYYQAFPNDSVYTQYLADDSNLSHQISARLNLTARQSSAWRGEINAEIMRQQNDFFESSGANVSALKPATISDQQRLFRLSYINANHDTREIVRLDRASLSYHSNAHIIKFGRQALSWGNGLFFNPVDFLNPFDPTALDTEYKVGDDMLYGQALQDNGNDLQYVYVFRRGHDGSISDQVATFAAKYHVFVELSHSSAELDIVAAKHFSHYLLGLGWQTSLGEALWRIDWLADQDDAGHISQSLVSNVSYSWFGLGKNMSAAWEYYYSDQGENNGDYSPAHLSQEHPRLIQKLERGESFALAQNYLASSLSIELHPLVMMTPVVFYNLDDQSALLQLQTRIEPGDELRILASLIAGFGDSGSEYGGVELDLGNNVSAFATEDVGLMMQLAWYF